MQTRNLLFLFLILSHTINAQKKQLTLEECLKLGVKNSIQLKMEKLATLQAQKQKNSYLNSLLPQVTLLGSHQYNFGSTIDPNSNGRVSQNFSQDFFRLNANSELINFENIHNSKNSKLNSKRAKVNEKLTEYNYISEITSAFFNALFTQELLKIQEKQLTNTSKNLDRIKNEVTIGNKPKSDLYDITLNFTQEEKKVLETQQQLQIQLQELANLLNEKSDFSKRELINTSLTKIISTDKNNNPEIAVAALDKQMSIAKYKAEKSKLLPTISLFYNMSSFYYKPLNNTAANVDDFSTQINNNKNQQLGLQFSFTLFDGFRRNKNIAEAKIESEKQELALENTKNKVAEKIKLEKLKKQQLEDLQNQLNTVYENAKSSFKTSLAKFESGKIELQVFNITKNQLLNAEYDTLKNRLQLEWTREKIRQLYGKN